MQQSNWVAQENATALRGFDVNVALFRGSIYQIHTMLMNDFFSREDLRNEVLLAVEYARDAEKSTGQSQSVALSVLDGALKEANSPLGNDSVHWSNSVLHVDAEKSCDYCPNSFLDFAVMNGLTRYVASRIRDTTTRKTTAGKPPLFYATTAIQKHNPKGLPDLEMIECIFQNGADANEEFLISAPIVKPRHYGYLEFKNIPADPVYLKTTPWKLMLSYLAFHHNSSNLDVWLKIFMLFLSHDADPSIEADRTQFSSQDMHSVTMIPPDPLEHPFMRINRFLEDLFWQYPLRKECLKILEEKRNAKLKT